MNNSKFTILGPENIGCGRKLAPNELEVLLGLRKIHDNAWNASDAHIEPITNGNQTDYLASSIDRIACFTDDTKLYVSAVFAHIENDIICSFAHPSTFSLSFSFTADDVENNIHKLTMEKVFEYASGNKLKIGKCHSYIDNYSSVTGHTLGKCIKIPVLSSNSGIIIATKKFGAMKTIYLKYIGYNDEVGYKNAVETVSKSHRSILDDLISSECVASDASGFGLDGALHTITDGFNICADINLDEMNFCSNLSRDIEVKCLEFSRKQGCRFINYNKSNSSAMYLSEVAGPLIVFVPSHKSENLLYNLSYNGFKDAHIIGAWSRR